MFKHKRLILIAILIIIQSCIAPSSVINFNEVRKTVEVESVAKNELYDRANVWLVKYFRDSNDVIKWRDKDIGTVSGKYIMSVNSSCGRQTARVFISIYVKDNKAVLFIKLLNLDSICYTEHGLNTMKQGVNRKVNLMTQSFEDFITKDPFL